VPGTPPPIVGIGASAGGLEAMTQFLEALPPDTGLGFVLVQHLDPTQESVLGKLLAKATAMPVEEAREAVRVEPDHVYVIPANAELSFSGGLLHVSRRKTPAALHRPIDDFFRSLAEALGSQAIGMILSGTASDGTAGLMAIKLEGGITLAQEPESARFDGMPRSAISAGCVDFVVPPAGLAGEVARIARHPFVRGLHPPDAGPPIPAREEEWARLFRLLHIACGVDFSFYKRSTLKRRLARRMALLKIQRLGAYLKLAEGSREELEALAQELLINVTGFFRDAEVFGALREKMLPQILAGKTAGEPLRIWVAGCSDGKEVYSIAICVLENLGDQAATTVVQIFGTDVNEAAIEIARAGSYPEQACTEVSEERLRRFFTRVNGNYEINPSVREMCLFARHDVTRDPPFSKIDLISCRNVLIYFEPVLQRRVLSAFHYALNRNGMLLLGKTEGLGPYNELFLVADRKHRFFLKNPSVTVLHEMAQSTGEAVAPFPRRGKASPPSLDLEKEADRIVWERYGHAAVVVSGNLEILVVRGDTSPYLRLASGKTSFQLLRMLRDELALGVRAAAQQAAETGQLVRHDGVHVRHNEQIRTVNVEVRPLPVFAGQERCYLILFEDAGLQPVRPARRPGPRSAGQELATLQSELDRKREYLQAIIRDHESTNLELTMANEEALSSMEELQSTNEELQTAKEELQSSNEELITLNDQLQHRNDELGRRSDELNNLMRGSDIPILILDREARIRLFTPPAEHAFGLLPTDVGRPIAKLRLGVHLPDLPNLIGRVLDTAGEERREVQSETGRWYLLAVRPFLTGDKKVEGALLAFFDIHEQKQAQESLRKQRNFVSAILDAATDLLVVVVDREGRVTHFNRACQRMTGYSLAEVQGRQVWEFLLLPEEAPAVRAVFRELREGIPNQFSNHWVAKDGRRLFISWSNSVAKDDGSVEFIIGTGVDHTERERARLKAQDSESMVSALAGASAQAILTLDPGGRIVMANPAASQMFGYPLAELVGLSLENLLPERCRAPFAAHLTEWFSRPQSGPMGVDLELSGLRKGGTEFPVEVSMSPVHVKDGMLAAAFVSDVSERQRMERTLQEYQEQLQRLAAGLLTAQENANRKLARDLHDVFSQEMAAVAMEISSLKQAATEAAPRPGAALRERLDDVARRIGRLADELHLTSRELHPAILEELGLEPALRNECELFRQRAAIPISLTAENVPRSLPPDAALCLYRVAQESLRNIAKHSPQARSVQVSLAGSRRGVTLRITDEGNGFDLKSALRKGGLGLISMEERVRLVKGRLTIQSRPGDGTTVKVFIPLDRMEQNDAHEDPDSGRS
jgi:PAS domain S-box-containing protein